MTLKHLLQSFGDRPQQTEILSALSSENGRKGVWLKGLEGSARSLALAALAHQSERPFVLVHDDADQAAYLYFDLKHYFDKDELFFLPASFRYSARLGEQDSANHILRTEVLDALSAPGRKIVVAYPESFLEKVVTRDRLKDNSLRLHRGEKIDTGFVIDLLGSFGFTQTDYVYEPGQFSLRGSLIDVYSWSNELPYRIDFFGDEIESIRSFEVDTQLSVEKFDEIVLIARDASLRDEDCVSLHAYFAPDTVFAFFDLQYSRGRLDRLYDELPDDGRRAGKVSGSEFFDRIQERYTCLEFGHQAHLSPCRTVAFDSAPQDHFAKNFQLAADTLFNYQCQGYGLCLLSENEKQLRRLESIFGERNPLLRINCIQDTLHEGFIDHDLKLVCYTDHQLFDRFHQYRLRSDSTREGKMALTLKELTQFQYGDYVVHVDHGVGRFGGLFKTTLNGKTQEVLKLMYKDDGVVLVSIHNLHRVSKYRGKEGEEPVIHRLGGGAWERVKERSKKKIKDIARDLIKIYAGRLQTKGFAYSPDSYLQETLEASFFYEDTPDQSKANADIKRDMESPKPMDRLVCGDVGFGKTELAIRAAFKAVSDGKQVAVLVPTTVLALQHYNTFSERLKDFPCTIDYLSRTRTTAQVKELLAKLSQGQPDIVIGTHKLIGKDVKFKDLGLLIIDEEQKFGVSVKEKLRQMKVEVDTLTLTATPIPRTLQFSVMGARDLSVLTTPPANRYPVETHLSTFDKELIREGIERELGRGGQVFFVNNRISDLSDLHAMLAHLCPQAKTAIAHGQMNGDEMEKIIVGFINHEYDILLSTSIVENGIDIPNANTIFVNAAHKFGLSDLHQLRGRVGRSNKKAYCYLLAPPLELLPPDAKRRLQAIESFSQLGSGLNIAMQDLDIRGAGNMLGAEQSGFITDLGFETYQRILREAMQELKSEEFSELFSPADQAEDPLGRGAAGFVADCHLESDLPLYFDETYVPGSSERMSLYREMDELESADAVDAFQKRLTDRFGQMPQEASDLLAFIRIRLLAKQLGIEKLVLKNRQMTCTFLANEASPFYQSDTFGSILQYVQANSRRCRLQNPQGKHQMVLTDIDTVETAKGVLNAMLPRRPSA